MKRFISLLITVLLVAVITSSCAGTKKAEKLRILIDQPNHSLQPEIVPELNILLNEAVDKGILDSIDQVEIEVVPNDGMNVEARNGEITRIRTEIFSGGGPDIFIIGCGTNIYDTPFDLLFPYPTGVMNQHHFMKLDDYIENAQYMEWDALNPLIMGAGRNEEGQYLLPLSYTFPATVYNMAEMDSPINPIETLNETTTWQDMLESDNKLIRHAAVLYDDQSLNRVASVFGQMDDGHENLTLSKEELKETFEIALAQIDKQTPSIIIPGQSMAGLNNIGVPSNSKFDMGRGFDDPDFSFGRADISTWDMAVIPLCSINGGVTATVTSYCGINSHTNFPDTAFQFLDFLLSKKIQQTSKLSCIVGLNAFPVYESLMQEDEAVVHLWRGDEKWFLNADNYQAVCRAKELITDVNFFSNTEEYLTFGFARCMNSPGTLDKTVDQVYREMKMGLAES